MSGERSSTKSSPGSRTSIGCPCCSATWREKPTPRPPPSSTAARRPSGGGWPAPGLLRSRLIRRGVALTAGDARNDARPLGPGESPPGLGRGDRQGRRTDELDRRADRGRRDRLDDGRGARAQVTARHVIESIAGGCRFGRLPDRARRNGLGCRDIRAGPGRGPSELPGCRSPRSTPEALPAPAKTEKPADPQETVTYRGPGPRRGGASLPGRCVVPEPSRVPEPVSLARPRHQWAGWPIPVRRAEVRFRYVRTGMLRGKGCVRPSWRGPPDTPSGWRTIGTMPKS